MGHDETNHFHQKMATLNFHPCFLKKPPKKGGPEDEVPMAGGEICEDSSCHQFWKKQYLHYRWNVGNCPQGWCTLPEINISHLGKRKIIFKYALSGGYVNSLEGILIQLTVFFVGSLLHPPKKLTGKNLKRMVSEKTGISSSKYTPSFRSTTLEASRFIVFWKSVSSTEFHSHQTLTKSKGSPWKNRLQNNKNPKNFAGENHQVQVRNAWYPRTLLHGVHGWVRLGRASDEDAKQDRRRWTLNMFRGWKLEGGEFFSESGDKKPPPIRFFMTMVWWFTWNPNGDQLGFQKPSSQSWVSIGFKLLEVLFPS